MVAELISERTVGAKGVTCRVVDILPASQVGTREPHVHDAMEEVIYVLEGRGEAWVNGDVIPIEPGDALLMPMGVPHMIINPTEQRLRLICFFPAAALGIPGVD
ncbi:hypothetical protein SY88_12365 [Clostridiales bacterium PH28_bin88]|nr:hypothetical protein SY88_12365 [Clostridiales bacterium PH28_bin88]